MELDRNIKEATEKQIKVFCPNCVNKAKGTGKELKEIIEEKSKPINTLQSSHDRDKYNGEMCDWHIFKHFSCKECGDRYVATYILTLERNLTLEEAFESAEADGVLFNTYRF